MVRNQGRQSSQRVVVTVRHVAVPDASIRLSCAIGILLSKAEEAGERFRANPSGLMETSSSQTLTKDTVAKANNNTGRSIRRQK